MDFEKWQALGNDYIIIDERDLPFELTEARIRRICAAHVGVGSDGILLLSPSREPRCVASMRIFNPDGSESGLSGNGSREAVMYLRRNGWTSTDRFSISTPAGEIRAQITAPTTCTIDMGHARLRSDDYPAGADHGRGELVADGRSWQFQHIQVGNPQCSIVVGDEAELAALALSELGPAIESHALFPNRTNASWYTPLGADRIRARIYERGVGETASSGTGATGAAVAHTLRGGSSPVTVVLDGGELQVEVGEDLHIQLTGWAVPVLRGRLAGELIEELRGTE